MSEQQARQPSQTVADALVVVVRRSARYNPDVESAPHCILWTDREQQWQGVIPALQGDLPELLVLGAYEPERRKGPAIWLRCAMAGTLDEVTLPPGQTPVIYLPGVGRQDLRAVESCPESLKPRAADIAAEGSPPGAGADFVAGQAACAAAGSGLGGAG